MQRLAAVASLMDSFEVEVAWIGARGELLGEEDVRPIFDNLNLWVDGQINNSEGDCVAIDKTTGLLRMNSCVNPHLFVCETAPVL